MKHYTKCLDVSCKYNGIEKKLCFKGFSCCPCNFHTIVNLRYMKMVGHVRVIPKRLH